MSIITKAQAITDSETVRDETVAGANTHTRVGQLFANIAESYATVAELTSAIAALGLDDVLTNGDTTSQSATFTDGNTEVKILPSGYVQITDTSSGAYCVINPYTISNNSGDGKYTQLDWSDGLLLKTSNVAGSKSATVKASNIDTSNKILELPNADGTLAPLTNTVTSGDTIFAPSGDAVYQALLALQMTEGAYISIASNIISVDITSLKAYLDTLYKATFSENTAFNKNFGTGVTNVPEIGATLTASKALVTDVSGKLSTSSTTATEIGYVNGVTSAIQTQLDNKSTQLALVTSSQFSPADATSYYYGVNLVGYSVPSTGGTRKMYVNRSGTITACSIVVARGGGSVSNEKASFYIHVNGGAGVLVTNNFDFSTSTVVDMNVTGLSISVSAGDYVEVEMLSPTWANNPINVSINSQLTIK